MIEIGFLELAWTIIAAMAISWLMVLGAVLVGGILVYRTKRESTESFFPSLPERKVAKNLDEADYSTDSEPVAIREDDPQVAVFERFNQENEEFLRQMAEAKLKPMQAPEEEGTPS